MRIPNKYRQDWKHPYTEKARSNEKFKKWLLRKGYLSPHFTLDEARCHDGTPVPKYLIHRAQKHAFNLEQLRHRLGDIPLSILSWFRDPPYNAAIGGASESRHMSADATDFTLQFVEHVGTEKFDKACEFVFANGGFGQYPSGSRHVDSRGYRARWTSF